jgi:hypothetical protein
VIVSNTLKIKEITKIYLIEQKIYPNHENEWYVYHSDLLWYVPDGTVQIYGFIFSISKQKKYMSHMFE